jgi:methionyl-tRNA formyltransferase
MKKDEKFNILFCGRDEFSCVVLERLYRANRVSSPLPFQTQKKHGVDLILCMIDLWNELHVLTTPDMMVGRDKKELSLC